MVLPLHAHRVKIWVTWNPDLVYCDCNPLTIWADRRGSYLGECRPCERVGKYLGLSDSQNMEGYLYIRLADANDRGRLGPNYKCLLVQGSRVILTRYRERTVVSLHAPTFDCNLFHDEPTIDAFNALSDGSKHSVDVWLDPDLSEIYESDMT